MKIAVKLSILFPHDIIGGHSNEFVGSRHIFSYAHDLINPIIAETIFKLSDMVFIAVSESKVFPSNLQSFLKGGIATNPEIIARTVNNLLILNIENNFCCCDFSDTNIVVEFEERTITDIKIIDFGTVQKFDPGNPESSQSCRRQTQGRYCDEQALLIDDNPGSTYLLTSNDVYGTGCLIFEAFLGLDVFNECIAKTEPGRFSEFKRQIELSSDEFFPMKWKKVALIYLQRNQYARLNDFYELSFGETDSVPSWLKAIAKGDLGVDLNELDEDDLYEFLKDDDELIQTNIPVLTIEISTVRPTTNTFGSLFLLGNDEHCGKLLSVADSLGFKDGSIFGKLPVSSSFGLDVLKADLKSSSQKEGIFLIIKVISRLRKILKIVAESKHNKYFPQRFQ